MKKIILFLCLFLVLCEVKAQPKIGITFSPSLSSSRVKYKNDVIDISRDGSALKFKLGLETDFSITETYSISTGLIFAPKRVGFKIVDPISGSKTEEYKLQYLQIPLTLKLYTNEVMPDIKAYFQLGFLGEIKVFDEALDESYTLVQKFRDYDTSFLFGIGAEYGASISSVIYLALVYNRGLVNIVNETTASKNLITKLDMLSLQIGIKF